MLLTRILSRLRPARRPGKRTPSCGVYRPLVEALESRYLLATQLVTLLTDTTAAASPGELRTAIANAAAGDTIRFQSGLRGSIDLNATLGSLHSGKDLTIQGPGPGVLSINGQNAITDFVVDANTTVTITGLTIRGGRGNFSFSNQNIDQLGGGVVDKGTLNVRNCSVTDNHGARGGGISCVSGSHLTMQDSTLSGNTADLLGGGAIGCFGTSVDLQSCTLFGNQGTYGGAIYLRSGDSTLANCTITGNTAEGGGAVVNYGLLTVKSCTITGNRSDVRGNGILSPEDGLVLQNSIVSGNGPFAVDVEGNADLSASFNNLIGTGLANNFVDGVNGNRIGLDPRLGPLQDNGGPTLTMALLADSPAIGSGDSALAAAAGLTTDQRGLPRISGVGVDIGAFEFQCPTTTITLTFTPNPAPAAALVTITATVSALDSPILPTGKIALALNGLALPLLPLSGGTATISLPFALLAGSYRVTADYSGATTLLASQATQVLVVLEPVRPDTPPPTPGSDSPPESPDPAGPSIFVIGADAGSAPEIKVFDAGTGLLRLDFFAYDPAFRGGVRVAAADVNGDGFTDLITGPGPGGAPEVRVFDGRDGALMRDFFAFSPLYTGGIFVAGGDTNRDGFGDIIVGLDQGALPEVRVFSGRDAQLSFDFFAFNPAFLGGVRVAAGDVNADGYADIICAAGPGGAPEVKVLSGWGGAPLLDFLAYDGFFTGGVYVGVGDVNGDGYSDIITGAGSGGGPVVRVFDGRTTALVRDFVALAPAFTGGVRVATTDRNGDGRADILAAAGSGSNPQVNIYDAMTLALLDNLFTRIPALGGGVFVGGA